MKPTLAPKHEANLRKLVDYLATLPTDYTGFDMVTYRMETKCGTIACALGHGPAAGIEGLELFVCGKGEPLINEANWPRYSSEQFGLRHGTEDWGWCFGPRWSGIDNTVLGAAKRILYYLDRGVPKEWFGKYPEDFATFEG